MTKLPTVTSSSELHVRVRRVLLFSALLTVFLGSNSFARASSCRPPMSLWKVAILYLGSDIESQGSVSDAMFEHFQKDVVIPRFPELTTTTSGIGRYRYKDGSLISEHTRIITFFFKDEAKGDNLLDQIVDRYKVQFHQEAVGRDERTDCAAFQ